MRKLKWLVYSVVFTMAISIACSSESSEPTVYSNPADTIDIKVGQQFKITLESNPSTGYLWRFVGSIDTLALKLVEHQYVAKPNPEKLVGRGGNDEWLFKALAAGSTSVALEHLQAWDSTSVERQVEFNIRITE